MEQEIRFCTTADGVRLAYALTGEGPPLVRAAHWLTHLEFDLKSPVSGEWIRTISATNRFLRYDERGCGLSDWDVSDFSLDAWVSDLETVVDAVGWERFPLMGISQGGPVAIAYAARFPERVSHLILYGTYSQGWRRRGLDAPALSENEAMITLAREGWGRESPAYRQLFAGLFLPGASAERLQAFNELQRTTTSGENAARFLTAFGDLDVVDLLGELKMPTLILHSLRDARCPFDEGRKIAAGIPHARFVPLDSANHILSDDEPAWDVFFREVNSFLGQEPPETGAKASDPVAEASGPPVESQKQGAERAGANRRVLRWVVPYAAVAWVVAQVLDVVQEPWGIGLTTVRGLQALLVLGLVATLVSAVALDARERPS